MWPLSCAEQPLLLTGDQDTSPKVNINGNASNKNLMP